MSTASLTARPWRPRHLLLAPHRLGFFLAMGVLVASGAWWAAVQADRLTGALGLSYALSPSLLHAAVMVFGFIPLYFAGFLFTAGPRWLGVPPPTAASVAAPLLAQALGWLLWLAGGHLGASLALAGLLGAGAGLGGMTLIFWGLVRASRAEDRLHAKSVGCALVLGTACLGGLAASVLLEQHALARAFVLTGLWGMVVAVYVTVAHRMIPFFTSSALPLVQAWRPEWVLWLLLSVAGLGVAGAWLDAANVAASALQLLRAGLALAAGVAILALAWAWGLVQSLKVRLVGMLHLGFSWLGLGLVLDGAARLASVWQGAPVLPLGALHAVTMGCLGSLMLAMVTRVSCGHSGRAVVADDLVWGLFRALQVATVLRIVAALPQLPSAMLLALAGGTWAAVVTVWGVRYGSWYGRERGDGRPG